MDRISSTSASARLCRLSKSCLATWSSSKISHRRQDISASPSVSCYWMILIKRRARAISNSHTWRSSDSLPTCWQIVNSRACRITTSVALLAVSWDFHLSTKRIQTLCCIQLASVSSSVRTWICNMGAPKTVTTSWTILSLKEMAALLSRSGAVLAMVKVSTFMAYTLRSWSNLAIIELSPAVWRTVTTSWLTRFQRRRDPSPTNHVSNLWLMTSISALKRLSNGATSPAY